MPRAGLGSTRSIGIVVALIASIVFPILKATPAHAAITHVQSIANTGWSPGASSISQAFASPNTAGNLIVAFVTWDTGNTMTCSDTLGNSYTTAAVTTGANSVTFAACYAANIASGSNTITATMSENEGYISIVMAEYSGVATTNPVDVISTNSALYNGTPDNATSGTATTTTNGDLIVGGYMDTDNTTTLSAGTGFTLRAQNSAWPIAIEDKVQATAGSVAATFSITNNHNYVAHMIAFRAAGMSSDPLGPSLGDGLWVYGQLGLGFPRWRTYNATPNEAGPEQAIHSGPNASNIVVKTSPTKLEAIEAHIDPDGDMAVACFDGTNWIQGFTVEIGADESIPAFDVAYETASGDVIVIYANDNVSGDELVYRTKSGSDDCAKSRWSSESTYNALRTSGYVNWIKLASDRRSSSNLISVMWADHQRDVSAMQWSGTAWGNEPASTLETNLQYVSSAQDVDNFDVEYESDGDVMTVWGRDVSAGTGGAYYATCTGGTSSCTWSAVTIMPTLADDATSLDISANPLSNEIVFASIGKNQSDLQLGYWSGSSWTNTANAQTSANAPLAGVRNVATGWMTSGATTRSVITYDRAGTNLVAWFTGDGSTFTQQSNSNIEAFGATEGWYDIQTDPHNRDRVMFSVADSSDDICVMRLTMDGSGTFTWADANNDAPAAATLLQERAKPYSFAFWQVVSTEARENTQVSVYVDPSLSFTVAGYNAGSCNGATINATSSTGTAVALQPTVSVNSIGGQTLTITSNSSNGFTIYAKSSGALSDGNGHTISDWTGSNASPTTFSSAGTANFGYTTDHALSGTATRFQTNKWASFTTSNAEVAYGTGIANNDATHVCVQSGISGATAAGSYSTTVTYTAMPVF